MYEVIDVANNIGEYAAHLAAAGVRTVLRYYNIANTAQLPSKCLSQEELQALFEAGLSVGVVFEQRGGAGGNIGDLDAENGLRDADRALELAKALGQPQNSAIYFAVDSDYNKQPQLDQIATYFDQVSRALSGQYLVGVYGSGAVGKYLKDRNLAQLTWLAGSRGWTGTQTALGSGDWTIFQQQLELRFEPGGFYYDANIINPAEASFGQFGRDGSGNVGPVTTPRGEGSVALFKVGARTRLNLRAGPGENYGIITSLPNGTLLVGREREGQWMKVDLEGDGSIDGYMFSRFLEPVSGGLPLTVPPTLPSAATRPIDVARAEMNLNVAEIPGPRDNPRILMYHRTTQGAAAHDEVPWCSSFVNYCVEQTGLHGTDSKWALSWHEQNWGETVTDSPTDGDIAVFRHSGPKGDGGHVGFFIGEGAGHIQLLGGNQPNRIDISSFPKDGMLGATRYQLMSIRRGLPTTQT